jgi:hypothetical protein
VIQAATHPRTARKLAALGATLLISGSAIPITVLLAPTGASAHVGAMPGAPTTPVAPGTPGAVTLTVTSVTPQTPTLSYSKKKLSIAFVLTNNTAEPISGVTIDAVRAPPISNQSALDEAMAHPSTPDPQYSKTITPTDPKQLAHITVPAGDSVPGHFRTTTDIPQDAGLCLCADAIYPIYLTATVTKTGVSTVIASTQTYLPAYDDFPGAPTPIQVGWLWPLLDRPHRLTSSSVFIDDDLAAEVAPGGRLDRALAVLEQLGGSVPLTVVVDPDLIDELQVMAQGPYRVSSGATATVAGVGTQAAAAWLLRLRNLLDSDPGLDLEFTPYGDPDVQSLQSNGLEWTTQLDPQTVAQISTALGGHLPTGELDWPATGTTSSSTLAALAKNGIKTVVLDNATVPAGQSLSPRPTALAALETKSGSVAAAITSPTIDSWAAQVLASSGLGATDIPQLVSQVALRSEESLTSSRYVLIAPPRDVDTDPTVAATAIRATTNEYWASPTSLASAISDAAPLRAASLKPQKAAGISKAAIGNLRYVAASVPGLTSLFSKADAVTEVGTLAIASSLATSSSLLASPQLIDQYAEELAQGVRTLQTSSIELNDPATRRYTLTSSNSVLPVSIDNNLDVPVFVDVHAVAVGGLAGFSATPVSSARIAPRSKVQLSLHTHFQRTGRIQIQVSITTPSGLPLSKPIQLSLRSTALGTIGVVITTVAAVVLAAALIVRFFRQLRTRRNGGSRPRAPATSS